MRTEISSPKYNKDYEYKDKSEYDHVIQLSFESLYWNEFVEIRRVLYFSPLRVEHTSEGVFPRLVFTWGLFRLMWELKLAAQMDLRCILNPYPFSEPILWLLFFENVVLCLNPEFVGIQFNLSFCLKCSLWHRLQQSPFKKVLFSFPVGSTPKRI